MRDHGCFGTYVCVPKIHCPRDDLVFFSRVSPIFIQPEVVRTRTHKSSAKGVYGAVNRIGHMVTDRNESLIADRTPLP